VDGLAAEREQGITIDVAYRYFSTPKRSFIIADTPGHEQYTRNMATGASRADLAIILIDARKGVLPQTRRHSFITSLVGIKSVIVAINKMDLVDFDKKIFQRIEREYRSLLPKLDFLDVRFIPISAKFGINIMARSDKMPWYQEQPLLRALEEITPPDLYEGNAPFRLPVQWVNRPNLDFRGYCGTIASGTVTVGDDIISLPSGQKSRIKKIYNPDGATGQAGQDEAVTVTFEDEIDTSRGDVIVAAGHVLRPVRALRGDILWMVPKELRQGKRILVKLATMQSAATIACLEEKIDIHSYQPESVENLAMNEIGQIMLVVEKALICLPYHQSQKLGSFILIDMQSHETLALGVVRATFPHLPDKEKTTKTASPLMSLGNIWLGGNFCHPVKIIVWRLLVAALIAFLAWLFGSNWLGSITLLVADFVLRPFARLILRDKEISATDDLKDGAGI